MCPLVKTALERPLIVVRVVADRADEMSVSTTTSAAAAHVESQSPARRHPLYTGPPRGARDDLVSLRAASLTSTAAADDQLQAARKGLLLL